jgi:2-oxoglutarate ferredoxin oxidoreductase subunit beta
MGHSRDIIRTLAHFPGVAYAARVALTSGARHAEARRVVRRPFEVHLAGHRGIKIIDALGNCNVNWKGGGTTFTPQSANDFIESTIKPYFAMGEQRVPDGFKPIRVRP